MGVAKATALGAAIFGSIMFGAWVGPHLTDHAQAFGSADIQLAAPPSQPSDEPSPKKSEPTMRLERLRNAFHAATAAAVPLESPDLFKRLKPLLRERAEMDVVVAGFSSAEDLAATIHAARNIKVPFMVLKHAVVDEKQTLAAAIHVAKPAADASLEADLARSEARADLAAIK
jgi:hypothetical protein